METIRACQTNAYIEYSLLSNKTAKNGKQHILPNHVDLRSKTNQKSYRSKKTYSKNTENNEISDCSTAHTDKTALFVNANEKIKTPYF